MADENALAASGAGDLAATHREPKRFGNHLRRIIVRDRFPTRCSGKTGIVFIAPEARFRRKPHNSNRY